MIQPEGRGWRMAVLSRRRAGHTGLLVILDADLANLDAIAVSDEALTFCNLILGQSGYVPALVPGPARHPLCVPALPT
jgi:hypothetical protein